MAAACTTRNGSFGNGYIAYGGSLGLGGFTAFCGSDNGLLWPRVMCMSEALQRPFADLVLAAYKFGKS